MVEIVISLSYKSTKASRPQTLTELAEYRQIWKGERSPVEKAYPGWFDSGFALLGDFSAIQSFVLRPVPGARGAAKRLRSRSFRVSAYTELIARFCIQSLPKSSEPKVLYSAGGRFLIGAKEFDRWEETCESLQSRIDVWAWQEAEGELAFNLAAVPFSGGRIPSAPLRAALERRRSQPLGFVLRDSVGWRLTFRLHFVEGGRVGGGGGELEIGGAVDPNLAALRNPETKEFYIPGSSLKGKLRSSLEKALDKCPGGKPCGCGRRDCGVCVLFGAHLKLGAESAPSRIVVRDCPLSEESRARFQEALRAGRPTHEEKTENTIDRRGGQALNPRTGERFLPGTVFDGEILVNIYSGDDAELFDTLWSMSLRVLEVREEELTEFTGPWLASFDGSLLSPALNTEVRAIAQTSPDPERKKGFRRFFSFRRRR